MHFNKEAFLLCHFQCLVVIGRLTLHSVSEGLLEVQEQDDARRPFCLQALVGIFKSKSFIVWQIGMRKMRFLVEQEGRTKDREVIVGRHEMKMVRFSRGFLFALNYDFLMPFFFPQVSESQFLVIFTKHCSHKSFFPLHPCDCCYNWQFVHVNSFPFFTHPLNPTPIWQPPVCSMYL